MVQRTSEGLMKALLAAAILAALATPVAASTLTLDCTFKEQGSTGWIPPRVILSRDLTSNKVSVIDGIVQTVYGAPIEAPSRRKTMSAPPMSGRSKAIPMPPVSICRSSNIA